MLLERTAELSFCCAIKMRNLLPFPVAGSTSLSLLLVRLLISHALLPYLSPQKEDQGQEGGGSPKEGVERLVAWILAGLTVFDSVASIFSTVRDN